MARTDPPIKLKRSVLRRVVTSKLDNLIRGEYYVRNHLGPECYDPIVAEAKAFLDSPSQMSLVANNGTLPQDYVPPSLSEDFDTFVQIIAASILIDASMRGENSGESDPRFIKKKKKLLTKMLKGVKFVEFTTQIWRYDCVKRGVEVPPEEESEEESLPSESNSSEDDSDQDNTSVTSHTSADGFSTSASNSKRHPHGSSSGSQKKKHRKEKKRLKKEKKHKRKEEKRRRKEEKKRRKEDKKKKKRKREMKEEDEDLFGEENNDAAEEEEEETNGKLKSEGDQQEEIDDEESLYEIEHATKEEFEAFREDILAKIPNKVKKRFRQGGFSRWGKDWLPVLEIGPFDVEPGPVRKMWMEMFHNTRQSGREMTRLVFWYGVKYEDRGQAYSFVPHTKLISFEEGEQNGHCVIPKKVQAKLDKGLKLTKTEEQFERGLRELQNDMMKDKSERIQWMMHFQEDYELAESMPDPEPKSEVKQEQTNVDGDMVEVKVKRKPGRPKKSESLQKVNAADPDKPVKRKPGRPKKSESAAAAAADAPIKRKPGRPKKSDAEKAKPKDEKPKVKAAPKEKKFVIVDEDDDYALESDDEDDKDYNEDSSDDSSANDSDDADDELSNAGQRKRKAADEPKKPRKKSKSHLTEEEEKEERRRKAAEYREKKRREKAEALGLDYVPGRKKSKTKLFEEEQKRFSECEGVFIPLMDQLEKAKDDHNVKSVIETIEAITQHVETLTPPFLRTYPLGMLVRDVRKAFESSDPEVKEHCKRLTNEMKRVYNNKDKNTPDDFVPKKRAHPKESLSCKSALMKKTESTNDVSMPDAVKSMPDAVKSEDTTEQLHTRNHTNATQSYPDQTLRTSEVVTTDPVKTDPVKSEPTKPPKKTFSIKGMFEKPKPIPKPKATPAIIVSGPVSPKPKSLPAWVTGPSLKLEDFHEQHAKERNLALEFLNDAASSIPSSKLDPMSISQTLELAIFAETKLRGRDWNQYWEKVHDVVAMISPGKNEPNAIMLGIARGDYQDPSQLVTLSRREIRSLNQQQTKSLL